MYRHSIKDLKIWYEKTDRLPLIIRGARQVGKSSLVKLFAESEKLNLIECNLEKVKIKSIHNTNINMHHVIDEILVLTKRKLEPNSIIFLDEIQCEPKMISLLRYFYEEMPNIPIVSAGSLLEFTLKEYDYSFPVGRVEFYYLGPMTFTEFLIADGHELLAEKILTMDLHEHFHKEFLEHFKRYLYIGGMPKAVKKYVESKSLIEVREIQQEILQTYEADFPKYQISRNKNIKTTDQIQRLSKIFLSSCYHLGEKLVYQKFDREGRSSEIKKMIGTLIDARVLMPAYHCEAGGLPLKSTIDESIVKLFFLDIGLVNAAHQLDFLLFEKEFENRFITNGVIAEQFIAQHLSYFRGPKVAPELYYWLRDKGVQKGEIDFLIQANNSIIPVEVKSSAGRRSKSIFYFAHEKKWKNYVKFSTEYLSIQEQEQTILQSTQNDAHANNNRIKVIANNIPIYAVEGLQAFLLQKK